MPIQHAVLALLVEHPSYGYELKASFESAIGPQWGDLNIGHLYQVLDRLVRDDLVTAERVPQSERPDKIMYRVTPSGRQELEQWLAQPFIRQGGYRDDLFLKLFAAARLGPGRLRTVTRTQRDAYLAELRALGALERERHNDSIVALLIHAAMLHTRANLEVVELADEQAEKLAAAPAPQEATPREPGLAQEG